MRLLSLVVGAVGVDLIKRVLVHIDCGHVTTATMRVAFHRAARLHSRYRHGQTVLFEGELLP